MAPTPFALGQGCVDGSPGKAAALSSLLDVPFLTCFPPVPTERVGGGGTHASPRQGTGQPLVGAQEVAERRESCWGSPCAVAGVGRVSAVGDLVPCLSTSLRPLHGRVSQRGDCPGKEAPSRASLQGSDGQLGLCSLCTFPDVPGNDGEDRSCSEPGSRCCSCLQGRNRGLVGIKLCACLMASKSEPEGGRGPSSPRTGRKLPTDAWRTEPRAAGRQPGGLVTARILRRHRLPGRVPSPSVTDPPRVQASRLLGFQPRLS